MDKCGTDSLICSFMSAIFRFISDVLIWYAVYFWEINDIIHVNWALKFWQEILKHENKFVQKF
jgi:hypothetical protein